MALLSLHQVTAGYGGPPLLDKVDLQLEPGERVCLIGRNGAGKTTLLRILSGEIETDSGEVIRGQGLKVSRLEQEVPEDLTGIVYDLVAEGLGEIGPLLTDYHHILDRLAVEASEETLAALERAQQRLEAADGWAVDQRIESVLTRLEMDPHLQFSQLSGGQKRRVLLARALVSQPDVLLLDEPTNHLDIRSIEWMEGFLAGYSGSLFFITHDRTFLQALATRIVELDRGRLISYPGNYTSFLEQREAFLAAEKAQQDQFDKRLAEEEVWIRRGVKARRARNEGRVKALEKMRGERRARRELVGAVKMKVQEAGRSGKLVLEARGISKSYQEEALFENFSAVIHRGDRIGILGPNGCGKSTLLSVLLGKLPPDHGDLRLGTSLEIAYYDQLREQLDEDKTVFDNVAGGEEYVVLDGVKKHVVGYLQDFLFTPDRCKQPVKALSGGERNRLLLARLFTRPANLLVLDEPTNDLDAETLDLLEERLWSFKGTLLLVSHDRAFLDSVVTSCFVFGERGRVKEYVGGYTDWKRQDAVEHGDRKESRTASSTKSKPRSPSPLSYTEKKLLEKLPERLEALEVEKERLLATMAGPGFYQKHDEIIGKAHDRLAVVEEEILEGYAKWEELEGRL